jgi:hypothetical protein
VAEPAGEGDLARVPGKLVGSAGEHHPGILALDDRYEHGGEVLLRAWLGPGVGIEVGSEERPQVVRSHVDLMVEEAEQNAGRKSQAPST